MPEPAWQSQLKLEIIDDLLTTNPRRIDSSRFGQAKKFMQQLRSRGFMLISIATYDRLVNNQRRTDDGEPAKTHQPHQQAGARETRNGEVDGG